MLRLRRVSLRTLIGSVLALFVFTLTALLAGLIGQSSIHQLRDRIGQSLATDAGRMAERLNSEMFARARELSLLEALDPLRGDPEAPAQLAYMQLLLDGLRQSFPFYTWLAIADREGRILASTDAASLGTIFSPRVASRDRARVGPEWRSPSAVAPSRSSQDPEDLRTMELVHPLRAATGAVKGMVAARIQWDWLRGLEQTIISKDDDGVTRREMFLVSYQDTVLVGPPDMINTPLLIKAVERARAGFSGWQIETWPDGRDYLTGSAFAAGEGPHPGPGSQEMKWSVVVREPVETALAPAYAVRRLILIVGFVSAIGFAGLGWSIAGWITAPLQRIAAAAERLRQGDDIELPNIHGVLEIHSLSTTLRALVATLTHKQVALDQMEDRAVRDPLTGLLNRSGLTGRFVEEAAHAYKEGKGLLIFLSDLDGFKAVNDTLGHAAGDQLLRHVAGRLTKNVRQGDIVGRLGGDEFVLVLRAPDGPDDDSAWLVAHRVRRAIAEPYEVEGKKVRVGCSLGGVNWPEQAGVISESNDFGFAAIIEKADAAMYDVKRSGKGRIHLYSEVEATIKNLIPEPTGPVQT